MDSPLKQDCRQQLPSVVLSTIVLTTITNIYVTRCIRMCVLNDPLARLLCVHVLGGFSDGRDPFNIPGESMHVLVASEAFLFWWLFETI